MYTILRKYSSNIIPIILNQLIANFVKYFCREIDASNSVQNFH